MPDHPATSVAATDDERATEILDIVASETGIERDRLTPDATIEALGIPSLDIVQSIFAIENRFGIEIPVVAERTGTTEFVTVGDLVAHVLSTIDKGTPTGAAV